MILIKNQGPKKLGQSTVEYLLVAAVASFFVLSLAVYMNPKLSSMLSNMEDVVAAKIRGGELVAHYKGGASGGGVGGETAAQEKVEGEGSEAGGSEGGGSGGAGGVGGGVSSGSGISDLEEGSSKGQTVAGGGGGGDDGELSSSSVIASRGRAARGSGMGDESQTQKSEGKKEKSAAEEDKSAKGRGILYQEGQEEEAIGSSQFNWMRLIIMLLIFIVVIFMAFEIYKSIKLSRK